MKRLGIVLAMLATPALAQTTTTNCYTVGNTLNCTSTTPPPPPPPVDLAKAFQNGYNMVPQFPQIQITPRQREQPDPAYQEGLARAQWAAFDGMMDEGKCAMAVQFARDIRNRAMRDLARTCTPK